jgi:uncharacterized membrane protein
MSHGESIGLPYSQRNPESASANETQRRPRGQTDVQREYRAGDSTRTDRNKQNVGNGERALSVVAGTILGLLGLDRRGATGFLIAGAGGALALRGITGRSPVYRALGVDTTRANARRYTREADAGVHVVTSYLINESPEALYSFWRNFENLPRFMSHLESVRRIDEHRSHWIAKAPAIYGGTVEWDAEITAETPNARIAWCSLPGGDVQHRGSIEFERALGDRGTKIRVDLRYHSPAGKLGRWIAKIFGEEPDQQIHDDLRNFKRLMEVGEILTTAGQPHGTCLSHARNRRRS